MPINQKKILIISYYAGIPGACQSEWLEDKIDSLNSAKKEVQLISGPFQKILCSQKIKQFRVPSISFKDFREELGYAEVKDYFRLKFLLMWPVALTFGLLSDLLSMLLTKGIGEGRWSWIISCFFPALLSAVVFRPDVVLTTGGPASAHVIGILVSKIIRRPVILELQDPLSGDDIGRNPEARGWLYRIEKFLIHFATKIVYVTKSASEFAKNEFSSKKVFYSYPGAKNFDIKTSAKKDDQFKLVHLGSLYASRNFKTIITAIDSLIDEGFVTNDSIQLINFGHVAPEIREEINQKPYVKIYPAVSRLEALEFASKCNVNLLIQNSDLRSQVTIPYKTYDYLNLDNTILGLLNSKELTNLIKEYGHVALDLNDVSSISSALKELLFSDKLIEKRPHKLDPVTQVLDLLNLNSPPTEKAPNSII